MKLFVAANFYTLRARGGAPDVLLPPARALPRARPARLRGREAPAGGPRALGALPQAVRGERWTAMRTTARGVELRDTIVV